MPAKKNYPRIPARETDDDNVVRQAQSQGQVRPDGPGDATAPVEPKSRDRAQPKRDRMPPTKPRSRTATARTRRS